MVGTDPSATRSLGFTQQNVGWFQIIGPFISLRN